MQLAKKYLNIYIITIIIAVAILLSIFVPSSTLDTTNGIAIVPVEKTMTVEDYVSSPIDSLIGVDDGTTIKASNSGTANGTINLVLLVLAIGSFVSVATKVNVFDQLINAIISSNLSLSKITVLLSLYFVVCATTFGLYESAVCYIPLLISLYKRFNVSPLYGIKVLILSVSVGYIASPINPFATMIVDQIANNTANLFTMRIGLLIVLTIILNIFLVLELRKFDVKPNSNIISSASGDGYSNQEREFRAINIFLFLIPYIYMTIGFIPGFIFDASMSTVTIVFIVMALIIGMVNKLSITESIDQMFAGVSSFLIIGVSITLARTVYIILHNAQVIDTIVYNIVQVITPLSMVVIILAIAVLFLFISYLIPSPSALAMITMPIVAPALELVGISIASTVTLFLFIHGISKMYSITSPLVIASINEANVEYQQYVRSIVGFGLLTLVIGLGVVITIA